MALIAGEEIDIIPICPQPLDAIISSKENFRLDDTTPQFDDFDFNATGRVIVTSMLTEVVIAGEEFDIIPICPHPLDAIISSKENNRLDDIALQFDEFRFQMQSTKCGLNCRQA